MADKNKEMKTPNDQEGQDDEFQELPCVSPEHNPPSHIYVPPGSKLTHICPTCGEKTIVKPNPLIW